MRKKINKSSKIRIFSFSLFPLYSVHSFDVCPLLNLAKKDEHSFFSALSYVFFRQTYDFARTIYQIRIGKLKTRKKRAFLLVSIFYFPKYCLNDGDTSRLYAIRDESYFDENARPLKKRL